MIVAASAVLAAAVAAFSVPADLVSTAGSGQPETITLGPLAQRSYVYAADGSLLASLKDEENRQSVPLADVPQHVIDAILAVEDAGFWMHDGYDIRGMLRAFKANVDSGGISQGGSTITQQLVKLDLLSREQTLDRKVQEIILAQRLEKQMTKQEILSRYLNSVYFGNHAYGIQAAAETYFGIGVKKLDVGQAALLAGIIRNPISYNPVRYPERAAERRDVALDRMYEVGALTEPESDWWHAFPTTPEFHEYLPEVSDYFPSEVRRLLFDTSDERFAMLGTTFEERRDGHLPGWAEGVHHVRPEGAGPGGRRPGLAAAAGRRRLPPAGRQPQDGRGEQGIGRRRVGRAGHRRGAHHGRRAGLRRLQVQPRHPERPRRGLVDEDVRAAPRSWSRATRPTTSSTAWRPASSRTSTRKAACTTSPTSPTAAGAWARSPRPP